MNNDRIANLCKYLDNNKARNYPIYNEKLSNESDYVRNSYFRMLAVVLEQGDEVLDSQKSLFQRQIAGSNCDCTMEDYLRQALEIEIEEYIEFESQYKETDLRFRFILDALLLISVEEPDEGRIKLVASIAESLKISKEELSFLVNMAKAILEQNESDYVTAEEEKPASVAGDVHKGYLLETGIVRCNDRITIIDSAESYDDLSAIQDCTTPAIKVINSKIKIDGCAPSFNNFKQVIIENCRFIGGEKEAIAFVDCEDVLIRACEFKNFASRTIFEKNIKKIRFENSDFNNCRFEYSADSYSFVENLGGVIYSPEASGVGTNYFENCRFVDCGGRNSYEYAARYLASKIVSNCTAVVSNCEFSKCNNFSFNRWEDKHYLDAGIMYSAGKEITMFPKESRAVNCQVVKCAAFA